MEQRIVKLQISNEYIHGSGVSIGAAGSHDDVLLEMDFRPSAVWSGTTRRAIFANALGENRTVIILTTNLLEDGQAEIYLVPVPQQAKDVAGECFLTVEGFVTDADGKEIIRCVTEEARFRVLPSKLYTNDNDPVTPSQAEQLQAEIDDLKPKIILAGQVAENEEDRIKAEQARAEAEGLRKTAETLRSEAEELRSKAEEARAKSENDRAEAERLRGLAEDDRAEAETARAEAENTRVSNENWRVFAETARDTAEKARDAAEKQRAAAYPSVIQTVADARDNAVSAAADAQAAKAALEKAIAANPGSTVIDQTLSVEGAAAEAAAVGQLKQDLTNFSLGLHTDGFLYIFHKGKPIGSGVSMPSGAIGDVVGNVDSENNIIVTGSLADGTYTVKYEMEDGTTIDIGELVLDHNVYYSITNNLTNCVNSNSATQVISGNSYSATITAKSGYELSSVVVTMGGSPVSVSGGVISIASVTGNIVITAVAEKSGPAYTNLLPLAVDASGNAFVGTNGEKGYKTGYRINSSGTEVAASGVECTGFMPYTDIYDTIYVKDISLAATETHNNLVFYDSSKACIKNLYISEASAAFVLDGDTWKISPSAQTNITGVAYFRFCAGSITDATIVTVNEEIV